MTTLISYRSSGGTRKRCDKRCYSARQARCTCICNGRNHGVGLPQAAQNTTDMASALMKRSQQEGAKLVLAQGLPLQPSGS